MRTFFRVVAVCSLCVLPFGSAAAAVISLDFNAQNTASPFQVSSTMTGEEVAGVGTIFTGQVGPWNALLAGTDLFTDVNTTNHSITAPLTTGNMTAGDGSATNVQFSFGTTATVSTPVSYQVFYGVGTGSTDLRQDMFAITPAQSGLAWELSGLLAGNSYNLVFFGQRYSNAAFNPATFTIFGNPPSSYDTQNDANFLNIVANGLGKITGTFTYTGGNVGTWSGLQIGGTFVIIPVPEPSAAVLLSTGLLGIMFRRRARRVQN